MLNEFDINECIDNLYPDTLHLDEDIINIQNWIMQVQSSDVNSELFTKLINKLQICHSQIVFYPDSHIKSKLDRLQFVVQIARACSSFIKRDSDMKILIDLLLSILKRDSDSNCLLASNCIIEILNQNRINDAKVSTDIVKKTAKCFCAIALIIVKDLSINLLPLTTSGLSSSNTDKTIIKSNSVVINTGQSHFLLTDLFFHLGYLFCYHQDAVRDDVTKFMELFIQWLPNSLVLISQLSNDNPIVAHKIHHLALRGISFIACVIKTSVPRIETDIVKIIDLTISLLRQSPVGTAASIRRDSLTAIRELYASSLSDKAQHRHSLIQLLDDKLLFGKCYHDRYSLRAFVFTTIADFFTGKQAACSKDIYDTVFDFFLNQITDHTLPVQAFTVCLKIQFSILDKYATTLRLISGQNEYLPIGDLYSRLLSVLNYKLHNMSKFSVDVIR
ncbi:hypothetical protein GJ496_011323 [Pomphorhynchus laevis]|nr:hypothetical protein GJ496_011323 [Pomphorhynchus laevis]